MVMSMGTAAVVMVVVMATGGGKGFLVVVVSFFVFGGAETHLDGLWWALWWLGSVVSEGCVALRCN